MTQTDDRQITPDLTFTQFEALKAIPKGHVFMQQSEPGTWRHNDGHNDGHNGFVLTSTMRSLIDRHLVKPRTSYVDGKRLADITPAGYVALSKAAHVRPKKKRRR